MLGKLLALFVVIIVIVGIALIVTNSNNSQQQPQLPAFQNTNGTVPSQFSGLLSQTSDQTTAQLASISQNAIAKAKQFSVSYSGTFYLKPSGVVGTFAKVNSPIYANESKYGNDTKLSINVTSVPIIGSADIVYINMTNGTYACTNLNSSAASSQNYGKLLSGSHSITCTKSNELAGINLTDLTSFNLSQAQNAGLKLNYQTVYQSVYDNMPCTFVSGIMAEPGPNGTTTGSGKFQICISDKYYVPLSFSMYFNGQAYIAMNLNETAIGNSSSQSYVDVLPGPLVGSG